MDIALKQTTVICGHYGVGKTNISLNLAMQAAADGKSTALIDLDLVNPYFRSADYSTELEAMGVTVVPPVFAGTTLDVPAISPAAAAAIADGRDLTLIDVGGDDAGATVLKSLKSSLRPDFDMLYVVNMFRPAVADVSGAIAVMREIEAATSLKVTGIIGGSHIGEFTSESDIEKGIHYTKAVAEAAGLPVKFIAAEARFKDTVKKLFKFFLEVKILVKKPWQAM